MAVIIPEHPSSKPLNNLSSDPGKIENLATLIKNKSLHGTTGIGHTRWATHGRPTKTNAHPHTDGKVAIVHNGIIENFLELKEKGHNVEVLTSIPNYPKGKVYKEFKEIPNGVIICRHISSQYNFAENFFSMQTKNSIRIQTIFHDFSNNNLPSV